jgi:hypothetical protein
MSVSYTTVNMSRQGLETYNAGRADIGDLEANDLTHELHLSRQRRAPSSRPIHQSECGSTVLMDIHSRC